MTLKPCGCFVGFCRAETLLDAATRAVLAGYDEQGERLRQAYQQQMATCVGGFRAAQYADAASATIDALRAAGVPRREEEVR